MGVGISSLSGKLTSAPVRYTRGKRDRKLHARMRRTPCTSWYSTHSHEPASSALKGVHRSNDPGGATRSQHHRLFLFNPPPDRRDSSRRHVSAAECHDDYTIVPCPDEIED